MVAGGRIAAILFSQTGHLRTSCRRPASWVYGWLTIKIRDGSRTRRRRRLAQHLVAQSQ